MKPVMLPPGREMRWTNPTDTGSTASCMKTMGMVLVSSCSARVSVVRVETRMSGRSATSSRASRGMTVASPLAQRSSMMMFSPGRQPSSRRLSRSTPTVFSTLSSRRPPER